MRATCKALCHSFTSSPSPSLQRRPGGSAGHDLRAPDYPAPHLLPRASDAAGSRPAKRGGDGQGGGRDEEDLWRQSHGQREVLCTPQGPTDGEGSAAVGGMCVTMVTSGHKP